MAGEKCIFCGELALPMGVCLMCHLDYERERIWRETFGDDAGPFDDKATTR